MAYGQGYGQAPGYGHPPGYGAPPAYGQPPGYPASYPPPGPPGYEYGPPGYEYGPPPPPPRRRAPVGVHIVAVLYYLSSLVLLLGAVAIGLLAAGRAQVFGTDLPGFLRSYGLALGALAAFGGVVSFLIARRLQRGRPWARWLVVVLSAVSLAGNLVTLFTKGTADPLSGLVLPILSLILLNTAPARDWFRRRGHGA